MTEIHAKPIVDGKFWVVEEGVPLVGEVPADGAQ